MMERDAFQYLMFFSFKKQNKTKFKKKAQKKKQNMAEDKDF